jgi:hypothetical protein
MKKVTMHRHPQSKPPFAQMLSDTTAPAVIASSFVPGAAISAPTRVAVAEPSGWCLHLAHARRMCLALFCRHLTAVHLQQETATAFI